MVSLHVTQSRVCFESEDMVLPAGTTRLPAMIPAPTQIQVGVVSPQDVRTPVDILTSVLQSLRAGVSLVPVSSYQAVQQMASGLFGFTNLQRGTLLDDLHNQHDALRSPLSDNSTPAALMAWCGEV